MVVKLFPIPIKISPASFLFPSVADIPIILILGIKNLRYGVKIAKKYYETEASGNVSLKTVKAIASTGVNRISIGSITHSVKAIDFKLEF